MQREIKFRAWNGKRMALPEYSDDEDFYITPEGEVKYITEVGCERHRHSFSRQGWVLMQYTGLKDRNGKEIYEGDIIQGDFPLLIVGFNTKTAAFGASKSCVFDAGNMYWFNNDIDILRDEWKVIGNIYEHPHLQTSPAGQPGINYMLDPGTKQPDQVAGNEAANEAGEATSEQATTEG